MRSPLASPLVNVMWRAMLVIWRARWRKRREGLVSPTGVARIRLTTLPTDIDILRHMNNGRYLSLFDLGRWDLLVRSGLLDAMREQGWYAVVSSETISFRNPLQLWQRFDVESRFIGAGGARCHFVSLCFPQELINVCGK